MTGYLFNYGRGRVNVHFVQDDHGWMDMHLRVREGVDTATEVDDGFEPVDSFARGGVLHRRKLRISAVFCPFPQMIAWLEAISLGLKHCSWQWDGEGPEYCLEWNGRQLVIGDLYGQLDEVRIKMPRRELVAAFYRPFRRFAGSRRYRPDAYEERRLGEIMVERNGKGLTEDELRGQLLTLPAAEVERRLQGLHRRVALISESSDEVHWPGAYRVPEEGSESTWLFPYVTSEWDGWDVARRRSHLREIFDRVSHGYFGTPLRGLRSEILERFLRQQADEAATDHDDC